MNPPTVHQRSGVVSLIGPREHNEDAFLVRDTSLDRGPVLARLAVADGMGGHEAGEVASRIAVESTLAALGDGTTDPDEMRLAFEVADREIRAMSRSRGNGFSMGTTLTFTVVGPQEAIIGHVGDSRAWLVHDGQLKQITADHSKVGRLLEAGVITESEVIGHPDANVLDQALGAGDPPRPDVFRVGVGPGDVLVLSTDGLHGALTRDQMEAVLRQFPSLQQACERLAALAQAHGSTDNVTVIAWQYPSVERRTGTMPPRLPKSMTNKPVVRWRPAVPPALALRIRILVGGFVAGFGVGFVLRSVK